MINSPYPVLYAYKNTIVMSLMLNSDICKIPYMYKESKLGFAQRNQGEINTKKTTLEFNLK